MAQRYEYLLFGVSCEFKGVTTRKTDAAAFTAGKPTMAIWTVTIATIALLVNAA